MAYGAVLYVYATLTGEFRVDGAIGVVLGLYVCSHPAANILDLLFMDGGAVRRRAADDHGIAWYALNFLVLLSGWGAVLIGVTHFVA
ncbi:MAG: hypothetical protein AB7P40_03730 [Chloroflexota bacterium]